MPSEHEPIDAHVKDGVVQIDPPPGEDARPPASPRRPATGQRGSFGCLVIPALLGLWLLATGIWQLTGWQTLPPVGRFGALVLTGFGLSISLAVAAAIWLLIKLRRLFTNLQRDAISLAEQMKFMATMGRESPAARRQAREDPLQDPALPEALDPPNPDSNADESLDALSRNDGGSEFPDEEATGKDEPESQSPDEPDGHAPQAPDPPAWRP